MDNKDYVVEQLVEMYQGEVIGEVLFNAMLSLFPEPDHQYKSATMLQLETETKARLRPALLELGASLSSCRKRQLPGFSDGRRHLGGSE